MGIIFIYKNKISGKHFAVINKDVKGECEGVKTNNVIYTDGVTYLVKELNTFEDEFTFIEMFTLTNRIMDIKVLSKYLKEYGYK